MSSFPSRPGGSSFSKKFPKRGGTNNSIAKTFSSSRGPQNWHPLTTSIATTFSLTGLAYSPSLDFHLGTSSINNIFIYSNNGTNWSSTATPETGAWIDVVWANSIGKFLAVNSGGTNRTAWSTDGVNWNLVSALQSSWSSAAWSQTLSMFVIVGNLSTTRAVFSSDATAWTGATNISQTSWSCVVAGGDKFVAAAGNYLQYTTDGNNWSTCNFPVITNSGNIQQIAYSPELKIFTGLLETSPFAGNQSTHAQCWYSYNGIDWKIGGNVPRGNARKISWSADLGCFIGVSNSVSNVQIGTLDIYSIDGKTWKSFDIFPFGRPSGSPAKLIYSSKLKAFVGSVGGSGTGLWIGRP